MKKIFIIGATAALAQDLLTTLAKDNTIITAGRTDCDVYCDITKPVTIPAGVDVVINLAADFGGESDEEIINAQRTNSLGTLNVCVAGKKTGVKHMINISSLSALLDNDSPYYSIYAITKRHADDLALFYCRINKIPLTILRPSQIYGNNDSFAKHQPFIYNVIDKAQSGEDISIYGENDALRNYIHSTDLAEVIKRTIEKHVEGIYSCMYPANITYSEIAQKAQQVFNKGGKIIFDKSKPDIPNNTFTKDLDIYEKTEYYPRVSLEEGLKMIKEYRETRLR